MERAIPMMSSNRKKAESMLKRIIILVDLESPMVNCLQHPFNHKDRRGEGEGRSGMRWSFTVRESVCRECEISATYSLKRLKEQRGSAIGVESCGGVERGGEGASCFPRLVGGPSRRLSRIPPPSINAD